MTDNDLRDLSIAELKDRREQHGSATGTSHIDDELEKRRQRRDQFAELLDLTVKLEDAKRNGFSDDLTIQRVEEQIADLASDLDTGPRAELARETGVDRSRVAQLSASEAEDALSHLEAIEHVENTTRHSVLSDKSAENNRAALESVLAGHDMDTAALEEGYLSDETGDGLAGVILESDDTDTSSSERAELGTGGEDRPTPQEELAEETGLTEAQASQFTDRDARKAVDLYKDLAALSGIPHEDAQAKYSEVAEELAELAADVGADKAALGVDSNRAGA